MNTTEAMDHFEKMKPLRREFEKMWRHVSDGMESQGVRFGVRFNMQHLAWKEFLRRRGMLKEK